MVPGQSMRPSSGTGSSIPPEQDMQSWIPGALPKKRRMWPWVALGMVLALVSATCVLSGMFAWKRWRREQAVPAMASKPRPPIKQPAPTQTQNTAATTPSAVDVANTASDVADAKADEASPKPGSVTPPQPKHKDGLAHAQHLLNASKLGEAEAILKRMERGDDAVVASDAAFMLGQVYLERATKRGERQLKRYLRHYPNGTRREEAMWLLATIAQKQNMRRQEARRLEQLLNAFPDTKHAADAQKRLDALR